MLPMTLLAAAAYLLGSIPFGLLIARWVAGVDLRKAGSGNIGATNVTRVLGKTWGSVVLLLDAAKGGVPAGLFATLFDIGPAQQMSACVLAGICAVLGHMFSPWLKFRGGKGVATATGVVLVLAPWGFLAAFAVFVALFASTRVVSIGSIGAAATFAVAQVCMLWPELWTEQNWSLSTFSLGVPALIIVQHRSNLSRLLRGEEHAFRKPHTAEAPPPAASTPLPGER